MSCFPALPTGDDINTEDLIMFLSSGASTLDRLSNPDRYSEGSRIMALEAVTNVVQLPAIAVNGNVKICQPDLLKLDKSDLQKMAMVMGGELLYIKFRATYTALETPLCNYQDCFRPVKSTLWCDDHENGKAAPHVPTLGIINPHSRPRSA